MNKKAQTTGLAIIGGLFVLLIGLSIVNFLMTEVSTFRIDLNCANPDSISDGTKLMCLIGDITIPYWIYLVFVVVIGGITARLLL